MQANVKTLSVRLGVKRVFWACIVLLELAYAGAIGLGVLSQVREAQHTCTSCSTISSQTFVSAMTLLCVAFEFRCGFVH